MIKQFIMSSNKYTKNDQAGLQENTITYIQIWAS